MVFNVYPFAKAWSAISIAEFSVFNVNSLTKFIEPPEKPSIKINSLIREMIEYEYKSFKLK